MRLLYFNPQPLSIAQEDQTFLAILREAARGHQIHFVQVVPRGQRERHRLSALRSVVQDVIELDSSPVELVLPEMQASEDDAAAFEGLDEQRLDAYLEVFERELQRVADRVNPDLVHVNYLWLGAAMVRSIFPSTPVVVSAHGLDLIQAARSPGLLRRVIPPARELQRVFVATPELARGVGEVYGIRSDRLIVAGRGVDALLFRPPETTASKALAQVIEAHGLRLPLRPALRIVYLGSADDPGLPPLIDVLRGLCPVGGGVIAMLLVEGSPSTCERLEETIPNDAEIYVLRHPASDIRAGVFRGSHVVIPRGEEAAVTKHALEALACGCRVNIIDSPALRTWTPLPLAHQEGVERVPSDDPRALLGTLEDQLERSRRGRLDAAALQVARRSSWEAIFRILDVAYRDAVTASRR